jgi:serine protease AprX
MSYIPIVAYHFSEEDEKLIQENLVDSSKTDSFFYGWIEPKNISFLKKHGILIDILQTADKRIKRAPGRSLSGMAETAEAMAVVPGKRFMIRLAGPLLPAWKETLGEKGFDILEKLPEEVYEIQAKGDAAPSSLEGITFVTSVRPVVSGDIEVAPRSFVSDLFEPDTDRIAVFDLRTEPENMALLLQLIAGRGPEIIAKSRDKIRIKVVSDAVIDAIKQEFPFRLNVEEYKKPVLHNNLARGIIHVDTIEESETHLNIPFEGEGQIIGVADTGIDSAHPDFDDRIYKIVARGRENDASDPNGHGTHVSGSILGNGKGSSGEIKGVAPKAKLFFQSILDAEGSLGGLPLNLADLFQEAYDEGVRIHNNSWGALAESEYLFNSLEVDEFVFKNKDMLLIISAGNDGSAVMPRNSKKGFADWLSIGSPATAKNALTVGASRSSRTEGGFSQLTYGQAWHDSYPDAPLGDEKVSGDPESIAGFSSRGPCGNETRIKPDIVAPGTDIASTRSSIAPAGHFWGPYPKNRLYAFMGGTSMSAPIVTGFAALIREYFIKERNYTPSAALMKAVIINSTRTLSGKDALADHDYIPNFHQGFGCIDMLNAIPNDKNPNLRLEFIDSWQQPELQFNMTGKRFLFQIDANEDVPLRFCLTWTDPPARGLQNNLNLIVLNKKMQTKWTGNETIPRTITALDRDNNVEIIRIDRPRAGEYLIAVQASNLLSGPQDFALTVTGSLNTSIQTL